MSCAGSSIENRKYKLEFRMEEMKCQQQKVKRRRKK